MKKVFNLLICLLLGVLMVFGAVACNSTTPDNTQPDDSQTETPDNGNETPTVPDEPSQDDRPTYDGTKTLVVYFSMPETTNPDNMTTEEANSTVVIDGKVLGNTQYMAYVIQENTGANIFRIIPEVPYPTDHATLVSQASQEQSANARPAIKDEIENFDNYDTVFVGYPNWWGDMPMILYTFFDTYDFANKTIIPFNTHGGSGFSSTISAIRRVEPEAEVLNGLSISRNHIQDAEQEIIDWVVGLGFEKPAVPDTPDEEQPNVPDVETPETPDVPDDNEQEPSEPEQPEQPEQPSEPETPDVPDTGDTDTDERNILIVYFTWSSNTERMANYINSQIGGEVVQIEAAIPYSTNYNEVAYGRAKDEKDNNERPEIKDPLSQTEIDKYDAIFVGFPIWWHTAPMIIGTFLESYTWTSDVEIYPFFQGASNSNNSYYTETMEFINGCATGATVQDGLYAAATNTSAINSYLQRYGFIN